MPVFVGPQTGTGSEWVGGWLVGVSVGGRLVVFTRVLSRVFLFILYPSACVYGC